MSLSGTFKAQKKNGEIYFRSSITYRNKHISLGSYFDEKNAQKVYYEASEILNGQYSVNDYSTDFLMAHDKFIVLINFRDNGVYIKTPIYMYDRYFLYYYNEEIIFKFDKEDLFFYSTHKISKRGGHYFVADYGMQLSLNSRYKIKKNAVLNRDYYFVNNDCLDYRYENIVIINKYIGVEKIIKNKKEAYKAKIHINGTYTIGIFDAEERAAIAYNKAADMLMQLKDSKNYELNDPENVSPSEYAEIYMSIVISPKIIKYINKRNQ